MSLKKLRNRQGITQKTLADRLGWTKSRIVRLENDMCDLSMDWARELAIFFDIPVEEMIREFNNGSS